MIDTGGAIALASPMSMFKKMNGTNSGAQSPNGMRKMIRPGLSDAIAAGSLTNKFFCHRHLAASK